MIVNILAFGIAKEIFGKPAIEIELNEMTVASLKNILEERYPRLKQLATYMVAVNDEYAQPAQHINGNDEIAIIPPVSGG